MCTKRCLASLLVSLTALVMVGCDSDVQGAASCDMPAPLSGQFDPQAPGFIITFHEGVNVTEEVERLSAEYPMEVTGVYELVLRGFAAFMSEETMQQIRCEVSIARVEYNASGTWGIQATPDRAPSW